MGSVKWLVKENYLSHIKRKPQLDCLGFFAKKRLEIY